MIIRVLISIGAFTAYPIVTAWEIVGFFLYMFVSILDNLMKVTLPFFREKMKHVTTFFCESKGKQHAGVV